MKKYQLAWAKSLHHMCAEENESYERESKESKSGGVDPYD